jgi:hypothetical protein
LDGDKNLDMAVANYNSGNVSVLLNLSNASSAVEEEEQSEISCFHLSQNYPNPFNPSTEIQFEIPRSGLVSLEIFNILGQRVRQLLADHLERGRHEIAWDGKNDNGEQLANGVYLYRITAGDFSDAKKMILLK